MPRTVIRKFGVEKLRRHFGHCRPVLEAMKHVMPSYIPTDHKQQAENEVRSTNQEIR